ncbi:MAG: cytochrome c maturation protein CcmE [Ilumatobacteraceae bacterium]|nr:cytochrome c maturation protein CcmE [Ilumatobacteraceae bacterium]
MDLTPRPIADAESRAQRQRRRWVPIVIVALALAAGGVVVTQFLTSAIDYYCNVDEVGVRDGCVGQRRIRVQGIVLENSLQQADGVTEFMMSFNNKTLQVRYQGDPGGVFQECIPVVAHGRVVDGIFDSDRIEVKHTNQYVEKNKSRFDEATKETAACSQSPE